RRMRRGDDELELPHFGRRHVDGAVGEDVRLDSLEQSETAAVLPVEGIDFGMLFDRAFHAHAAGDTEAIRMVRDPRARPAAFEAGVHDRLEGFGAVAPDRMHLEVAAIACS